MKTITKIATCVALFLFVFLGTSCKKDDGALDGMYKFGYIYDVTFEAVSMYSTKAMRISLRDEGKLDEFLEYNENMGLDAFSFMFSGSDCQMFIDGELWATGTYEMFNNRLVLNFLQKYKALLTLEYKRSPETMFVWDQGTYNTMGLVALRVYGLPPGYTVNKYQICVAMKK